MDYDNPDQAIEDWKAKREAELDRSELVTRRPNGQIEKGSIGLSPGRPKGSRNKLGEAFVADLYEDWKANGLKVLEDARQQKPADYLKVVASILPKDIKVSLETMDDGELARKIDNLAKSLGVRLLPAGPVTDIEDPP